MYLLEGSGSEGKYCFVQPNYICAALQNRIHISQTGSLTEGDQSANKCKNSNFVFMSVSVLLKDIGSSLKNPI